MEIQPSDQKFNDFCKRCQKPLSKSAKASSLCKLYLLQSLTTELPQEIDLFFHPRPLTLHMVPEFTFTCITCSQPYGISPTYYCERFRVNVDMECAKVLSIKPQDDNQIQHFNHWHPLTLLEKGVGRKFCCVACGKLCLDLTYGCTQCNFYLHKLCMDIPREIQHFFHPCPLTLLPTSISYKCAACKKDRSGLAFYFGECYFHIDVECALWSFTKFEDHQQIQHISHGHPLTLVEQEYNSEVRCEACRNFCCGPSSQCNRCKFYLRKSCSELPQEIQHFFHPSSSLTLYVNSHFYCQACYSNRSGFMFMCSKCVFSLDIECALLPTMFRSEGQDWIEHFSHGHPLVLCEIRHNDDICCKACKNECLCSHPTYGCNRCNVFYLHKLCAELPQEIHYHPFHPRHTLALTVHQDVACSACNYEIGFFAYHCAKCSFFLDVNCIFLSPSIQYDGHRHLLALFQKGSCSCNFCGKRCKESFLRCVLCGFDLHLYCHPLFPQTVKHKCHIDLITLINYPPHEEHDDPNDAFYCDACENLRDRSEPVYYCAECHFVAQIKCVISEVCALILQSLHQKYCPINQYISTNFRTPLPNNKKDENFHICNL